MHISLQVWSLSSHIHSRTYAVTNDDGNPGAIFFLLKPDYYLKFSTIPTPTSSISTVPANAIFAFRSVQWQG